MCLIAYTWFCINIYSIVLVDLNEVSSIFGHRLGKAHVKKKNIKQFNHRGDKCDEIARGRFSKIAEIHCLSGREFGADNREFSITVNAH